MLDNQMVFLKEYFKKLILKKSADNIKKSMKNFLGGEGEVGGERVEWANLHTVLCP